MVQNSTKPIIEDRGSGRRGTSGWAGEMRRVGVDSFTFSSPFPQNLVYREGWRVRPSIWFKNSGT